MRIIVGYGRVSTADQAAEGVSLAAQEERIENYCASRGGALHGGTLYLDAGLSGKRADNRPGLQSALNLVCASRGVLVVYSLSRLARSTRDALAIADRLGKAGADLVSLTENLDTTTANGKLMFGLLAILAEFERNVISERTRGALAYLKGQGRRTGQVPYGRRLDPDREKTLTVDPEGLAVVALVGQLHREGSTLRQIAAELDRRDIPTKNGGPTWSASTVRHLVNRCKREAVSK